MERTGAQLRPKVQTPAVRVAEGTGLHANQEVTFLTGSGGEVRALTELVTPQAEHVLDWFRAT